MSKSTLKPVFLGHEVIIEYLIYFYLGELKVIKEKFYDFNPEIKKIISINIRKYRKLRGFTQEQLALYTELSYDFIRRIETSGGKSGFSVVTLYKISTVLEVSIDDLIKDEK